MSDGASEKGKFMSINIQPKTDYSSLFSSIGNAGSNMNFLSDYASIRNGSYKKLMKAYYSEVGSKDEISKIAEQKQPKKVTKEDLEASVKELKDGKKDSSKALAEIEKTAENVKSSVDKVMSSEYENEEAAYKAVDALAKDYNALIEKGGASKTDSIQKKVSALTSMTDTYKSDLEKVGIAIGKDKKLTVDKEKFLNSDMGRVEDLFSPTKSFGRSLSEGALLIDSQANYEAMKADVYTRTGTYSGNLNVGNIMDSMF